MGAVLVDEGRCFHSHRRPAQLADGRELNRVKLEATVHREQSAASPQGFEQAPSSMIPRMLPRGSACLGSETADVGTTTSGGLKESRTDIGVAC